MRIRSAHVVTTTAQTVTSDRCSGSSWASPTTSTPVTAIPTARPREPRSAATTAAHVSAVAGPIAGESRAAATATSSGTRLAPVTSRIVRSSVRCRGGVERAQCRTPHHVESAESTNWAASRTNEPGVSSASAASGS